MTNSDAEIRFENRVVVITGAAGSLGRAYATAFAELGAKLVINDPGTTIQGDGTQADAAEMLAEYITSKGGSAIANSDSVADREGAVRLVSDAVRAFGRIDILINNAGTMRDKVFKKVTLDDFQAVVDVNLMGTVFVTHAAFPLMIEQEFGRIIMTTSASGLYGVFGAANYAAAKLGVVGLMNSLCLEGERHNVLTNSIAPIAASRMMSGLVDEERYDRISPEHVTPMVLYLCSNNCRMNGGVFSAGGGYFSKVEILEGQGVRFDGTAPQSAETIAERFSDICDMSAPRSFSDSLETIKFVAEAN